MNKMPAELSFPSSQVPNLPAVKLVLPDGWEPLMWPGCIMAGRATTAEEGLFAANVVVRMARQDESYDLVIAEQALEDELNALPDARVGLSTESEDSDSCSRTVVFNHPEAGTLVQVHVMRLVRQPGCTDVVQVVGTCAGDRTEQDIPLIQSVLSSARIASQAPDPR